MGNLLTIYNLGQFGVNVDKDPVELEDGELTAASNMIPSPTGDGAIINREGLVKFNSAASADTSVGIVGGIGVPLPLSRRIYLAQSGAGGATWLTTTTAGFTSAATQATVPGAPARPTGVTSDIISSLHGVTYAKVAANFGNTLVYASNNYTQGVTSPKVNIYDGSMDRPLFTVPTPTSGVVPQTILWLVITSGYIYFSVYDAGDNGGGGASTFVGSTYQYTIATNTIKKLGVTFPTGYLPYTLCWANDRLWVGTISSAGESATGKVYWIRPNVDTSWTLDKTFGTDIFPTTMLSFNGELYVGTYSYAGGSAIIQKRSTAGVWSTVDTAAGTSPTGENWYDGMIQFGTSLYVGYKENGATGSKIRKFDGTSWTTAKSSINSVTYNTSFTDNGVLYFWGEEGINTEAFLSTTDGTTWADRTANVIVGGNRPFTAAGVIIS